MSERYPSVDPSYKPAEGDVGIAMLPAYRASRRLPRSRTRVAMPLSETTSLLPLG